MTNITVWRLISHHSHADEALTWFKTSNRIAIGWSNIGDLRQPHLVTSKQISTAIREDYPDLKNAHSGGRCLQAFRDDMKPGDLVIISDGSRRRAVVEITGDYTYAPKLEPEPIGDYQNQRQATEVTINPDALWKAAGAGAEKGHSTRWTLIRCRNEVEPSTVDRFTTS